MWSVICAVMPSELTLLCLTMDFYVNLKIVHPTTDLGASPEADIILGDIDHYLAVNGDRDLEGTGTCAPLRFEVFVSVGGEWKDPKEMRCPSAVEVLVRKVFWQCEILSVRVNEKDRYLWI